MWWPFNLQRPATAPTTRELLADALGRIQLLEDRLEQELDALRREAARVEQANRRAEAREVTKEQPVNGGAILPAMWELARRVNRGSP